MNPCTKLSVLDDGNNGLVYQGSLVYQKQGDQSTLESAAVAGGRIVDTAKIHLNSNYL